MRTPRVLSLPLPSIPTGGQATHVAVPGRHHRLAEDERAQVLLLRGRVGIDSLRAWHDTHFAPGPPARIQTIYGHNTHKQFTTTNCFYSIRSFASLLRRGIRAVTHPPAPHSAVGPPLARGPTAATDRDPAGPAVNIRTRAAIDGSMRPRTATTGRSIKR